MSFFDVPNSVLLARSAERQKAWDTLLASFQQVSRAEYDAITGEEHSAIPLERLGYVKFGPDSSIIAFRAIGGHCYLPTS